MSKSISTNKEDKIMDTQIIEINGVKLEVDMRYAKRVDTFKIGTKVKVLLKSDYSEPSVKPGVIVGFEPFQSLPTIIVAYLDVSYASAGLKIAHINSSDSSRKNYEIVASVDDDLPIDKASVQEKFDADIARKQEEIEEIERKKKYFLEHFGQYFESLQETFTP